MRRIAEAREGLLRPASDGPPSSDGYRLEVRVDGLRGFGSQGQMPPFAAPMLVEQGAGLAGWPRVMVGRTDRDGARQIGAEHPEEEELACGVGMTRVRVGLKVVISLRRSYGTGAWPAGQMPSAFRKAMICPAW